MKPTDSTPPPGSRCLVTGATGFTGQHLVRRLIASGCTVAALARPSSNRAPLADCPVEWIEGEVFDAEAVRRAVRGVQFVFHLAAAYRKQEGGLDYYRQVHVESTRLLLEAVRNESAFRRFVHVSTVGVHGHVENPPANENAPFAPGDIYQTTKLEGETWVREQAPGLGIDFTVIRPVGIFGPGDDRLLKFFKTALWPVCPLLGYRACLYHLIRGEDLARALCLAAVHPEASGEVFIAGNREATSLEEIASMVASTFDRRARFIRLPAWPFFALAGLSEKVCGLLNINPVLHRRRVAFYTKDRSFDTSRLHLLLGFEESEDTLAGVRSTALAYREAGKL